MRRRDADYPIGDIASPIMQGIACRHAMGTTRMGTDPELFVTNPWGRCHDVKNLFIADSSLFA